MPDVKNSDWVTCPKLAALLSVSSVTLYRWQHDAKLGFPQPTVVNKRKYWSRQVVDDWMRKMATGKAQGTA